MRRVDDVCLNWHEFDDPEVKLYINSAVLVGDLSRTGNKLP
jgi:hypothetical protein